MGVVAVVLKGYPRLSETFIAQELRALEERGLRLALYAMRHPHDPATHPVHAEIRAPVTYLPEYLHDDLPRVWRAWRRVRRLPGYRAARAIWRRDLLRDRTRVRVRSFGQALVLAAELPGEAAHLHAHFLHAPASVTRYAATIRGLAWSCSAHAKDIWTTPVWEKREKLGACAWATTCTAVNARHLREISGPSPQIELNYHGIDTRRFPARAQAPSARDGRDARAPVLEGYRGADIFVLPCRVSADGDRDGLPNVLLEAQSQELACISTKISGIPELIEDGVTGLLVDERAPASLAKALQRLIADPALRRRLGEAGFARTTGAFSMAAAADRLAAHFEASLATAACGATRAHPAPR